MPSKYQGSPYLSSFFAKLCRSIDLTFYRMKTRLTAAYRLLKLSNNDIRKFMDSYSMFEGNTMENKDENLAVDYYYVLNNLCALGNVEKMYIPPLMDKRYGVIGNQELYERKQMEDIGIKANHKVLDIGCGRGRVAMHTAKVTGAYVVGINLDASQIQNAQNYAKRIGLEHSTEFKVASMNDPLPFPDEYFDAAYNVQAFSYSKNPRALFKEIVRVLKPGAKFSYLDWVLLDPFDANNAEHMELMEKTMPALGAASSPYYRDIEDAIRSAGLRILVSEEASSDGPTQAPLINVERKHYKWVRCCARCFLPRRFMDMLLRIKVNIDAFVEGVEEGIFTTSYQIVCQKPFMGDVSV